MSLREVPASVKLLTGVWAGVLIVAVALAGTWLVRSPGVNDPIAVAWPSDDELRVAGETTVLFGHQSVGTNILDGVARVYADASAPAPVVADVSSGRGARGATLRHAYLGLNGEPLSKFEAFADVMDGPAAEHVDVALMKLCYADVTASTDVQAVFDAYVSMMSDLEAAHPDVRFLYTTVPLTADRNWRSKVKAALGGDDRMGPADNVARERYNAMIRERYAASGRLLDIAAVESAGTEERSKDGNVYYVLNEHLTVDRGHLNEAGSEAVAAELLKMVATYSPVAWGADEGR
ncbi:hypothetical protein [Nocardioides sp. NPDC047086]|uniref:hypothetical protein n=1 Tax=Nocardioides sp. NPDC047086 TaxID=3154810 RepID=UPI00340FD3F4